MTSAGTATRSKRLFMPFIPLLQLRSANVRTYGCGNVSTAMAAIDVLQRCRIKGVSYLPINDMPSLMAGPFTRTSFNALSIRLLATERLGEIDTSQFVEEVATNDIQRCQRYLQGQKINLGLAEKMNHDRALGSFTRFLELRTERGIDFKGFEEFCGEHEWWLGPFAFFKALEEKYGDTPVEKWDREYADMTSTAAKKLMGDKEAGEQMQFFKYVQWVLHKQIKDMNDYARSMGIEEIEHLMGVGVDRMSAEGFLMQDIFDPERQIGCFPEPENGYPVQLWGFPAPRMTPQYLDFIAKTFKHFQDLGFTRLLIDHAAGFLGGYTTFPIYDPGDRHVLDAQNPKDAATAERLGKWEFLPGQQEAERHAYAKQLLAALLAKAPGISLSVETVGDKPRRLAAEEAVKEAIAQGHDITLMESLPWAETPLAKYPQEVRLSHTHDFPPLTALLTGKSGAHTYPWINGIYVAKLLNRLGILSPQVRGPIDPKDLTRKFMFEIHRRIVEASTAGTVVLPITSLFTFVGIYLGTHSFQRTNLPGGLSEVGNDTGNWEYATPCIEDLLDVRQDIRKLAERKPNTFTPPVDLSCVNTNFRAQMIITRSSSVVYQAKNGNWTTWSLSGEAPLREIAVVYNGSGSDIGAEEKAWTKIADTSPLGFRSGYKYIFQDLVTGQAFTIVGDEILRDGLNFGLNKENDRHHFVMLEVECK